MSPDRPAPHVTQRFERHCLFYFLLEKRELSSEGCKSPGVWHLNKERCLEPRSSCDLPRSCERRFRQGRLSTASARPRPVVEILPKPTEMCLQARRTLTVDKVMQRLKEPPALWSCDACAPAEAGNGRNT